MGGYFYESYSLFPSSCDDIFRQGKSGDPMGYQSITTKSCAVIYIATMLEEIEETWLASRLERVQGRWEATMD